MIRWLAFLAIVGCAPARLPEPDRVVPVRVTESCRAFYGERIYDALYFASDYWAERRYPRLAITELYWAVPVQCPTDWPAGESRRVKGMASKWFMQILAEDHATDGSPCETPQWHLGRVVTHEIGHMHGLGHSAEETDLMHPQAAAYCVSP